MARQVLKIHDKSCWFSVVFHEDQEFNPYWVYKHTMVTNKFGYYTERKRIAVKYAELKSCLFYIANEG